MNFLFIGGHFDGQRMNMPDPLPILKLPIPIQPTDYSSFKVEDYKLTNLAGDGAMHLFYCLSGMSTGDMLGKLISGYKP